MTAPNNVDDQVTRIAAGDRLSSGELAALAKDADILPLGMLADAERRRRGTSTTYVRVCDWKWDHLEDAAVEAPAGEVRLVASPDTLDEALAAVRRAVTLASGRVVSAFAWTDVAGWADSPDLSLVGVLRALREAGLEALAEVLLTEDDRPEPIIESMGEAGFRELRLGFAHHATLEVLGRLSQAHERHGGVRAIDPLPRRITLHGPTTGYQDVRAVALARLAAPNIPTVQVDWRRYGPKLAQVALAFGADDLDNVAATNEAPDGKRRAPLEDVQRNIRAAGFEPVERDGRFRRVD